MTLIEQAQKPISELVELMNYKLDVHKSKNHWGNDSVEDMYHRFRDEVDEVKDAMWKWAMDPSEENWREVEYELGDVGNFSMMMIDIARTRHYPELRFE